MSDPWDGFPVPEPFIDAQSRFITPHLTHTDSPQAFRMPPLSELKGLGKTPEGQAQLREILARFNVGNDLNYFKNDAADYVKRMTTLTGEDFKRAVNDLVDYKKGRALLGSARRVQQQYAALRDIDGNVNQRMIRVDEGDERECENCEALAGEIRTYADWAGDMPGSQSCYGGDACRCTLHPVD